MHAVASYLPDFASPKPRAAEIVAPDRQPALSPTQIAELKREAVELGRREGEEAARAAFELQRAEDAERFVERLAAERAAWCEEQSAVLASAMTEATGAMEAVLSERLARIVTPFLEGAVRQRALAELEALMVPLMSREEGPVLKVMGPSDLLDALRTRLGDPVACVFEPADTLDVRLVAGETVLETQIGVWLQRLRSSTT